MSTLHYPVLVIEDVAGEVTAFLADDWNNRAAVAGSRKEALRLLVEGVEAARQGQFTLEPSFLNAELRWCRVDILPEYRAGNRIQPCAEPVALRVPYLHGLRQDGGHCCSVPTLGLNFDYFDAGAREDLVRHYIRSRLQSATPRMLSRFLAPRSAVADEIIVSGKTRGSKNAPRFSPEKEVPILNTVAEPLSSRRSLSGRFSLAFGRDALVKDLAGRLRSGTLNLLLVGEPGVGKTTVMARLAREYVWGENASTSEDEAEEGKDYRFWLTNGARLISGMKYLGQWEERCEKLVQELANLDGFLCIENLLDLAHMGGTSAIDSVAAFLAPFMQRSELRMIAETTPAELDSCRRILPGLADVFDIIRVEKFLPGEALKVSQSMESSLKSTLKVEVEPGVAAKVQALFGRFLPYQAFPGKAANLIRQLFQEARAKPGDKLTKEMAAARFQEMTGLPSIILRDDLPLAAETVAEALSRKVISQRTACELAAEAITAFKSGVNDPGRPVAVLLFSGPTGVGKTALAKAISEYLFGAGAKGSRLLRLDMSEYAGPWAAERLLQQANGEPSELVRSLRQQPFSVVLFDEIEKANPVVFDVLMNVFDEGRLTDNRGRVTYFLSSIIIVTSNLGAQNQKAIGFTEARPDYERAVAKFFRPEFFNRIDAVVPFQPLDHASIRTITVKELREIAQREGLVAQGIQLRWTEAAVDRLAAAGFDERYGARPLQRALERAVVAPLARLLAEQPALSGRTVQINATPEGRVTVELLDQIEPDDQAKLPAQRREPAPAFPARAP